MELKINIPSFIKPSLYNNHKFNTVRSARRSGKTYNTAQWIIEELLTLPSDIEPAGLWVDVSQSNIDKYVEREFYTILKPIRNLTSWNTQKKILKLPGHAYIDFGSAERPENLEGRQYARGVLNEAGIILKKPSLWDNSLYPMLKEDYARTRIIGTPKGKNKFHELSVKYPDFHYTAHQSPFWTEEQIEEARRSMPEEVFRQEILAEFIEGAGSVFRNIRSCIREPKARLSADILGIDLAKHEDFTVLVAINSTEKQVIEIDRFNQIDWTFQKNRILNFWNRVGRPKTIIDSTGVGDPIFDDLSNAGMTIEGYKFTNQSKSQLIQGLSVAMDNGEIFFPANPELLGELEVYGYDMTPMGTIRYNAPSGLHDDMVIALALANFLLQNRVTVSISWL